MRNFTVWFMLFFLVLGQHSHAADPVEIHPKTAVIDLSGAGTPIAAQRRNIALDIPGEKPGQRMTLELRANGPGPDFNWTLFSITSSAAVPRKIVLAIEEQKFSGSGLLKVLPFGKLATGIAFSTGQQLLEPQSATGSDAVSFTVQPGTTLTFAIEGAANIRTARIYSQEAFSAREASLSFLRGAVLSISVLLAFSMIALYGMRAHAAFFAGGFFALTAFLFMAFEGGYLADIALRLEARGISVQSLRAVIESLFLLGLVVCVSAFNGLRQRGLLANLAMLMVYSLCIGNIVFAFFDPPQAASAARLGFGIAAALAFLIGYGVRKSGYGVVHQGLFLWSAVICWAFFASVAAVSERPDLLLHSLLLSGLATVLVVMAFTLVRFAFAQGFLAQPFLTDAGRRSLALSGAQHYLWDWQPFDNHLEIGPDLARSLGYDLAAWQSDAVAAFTSILHPDDEPIYRAFQDMKDLEPNHFHEQELRLKDSQGEYRWFSLRARVLPGPNNKPSRAIGTLTDVTRGKAAEDRLITDAVHDPVTGLPSRAIFLDRLAREIEKPLGLRVHVLIVGLQRFKTLNDGLGHDLGDQLLLVAGQRIAECLGPEETVARVSGSQFAVMFVEGLAQRDVMKLARDIVSELSLPVSIGNRDVYLSASIGVSLSSADGYVAGELQQQATGALHEALRQGRKAIVVYETSLPDERSARVTLETDLRRALERNEIEVHYQPIVSLETRAIAGLEALARWRHPEQGLLAPAQFIGMAEQAGMIAEISDIVLTEAARQMGIWQRVLTRARPIYIAVNMSADQLTDLGFAERLRAIINREGLRPNTVKIELTESVVMRYPDRARQLITKLGALGVGVACDDFGTGFSSLASLRDLPFDTLKIDRSFLLGEALEGRGGVILDTVVSLAHNLGMIVVAEGIENQDQLNRLQALGCDLGQGFLLGQALSAKDVQPLLAVLPRVDLQPVYVPDLSRTIAAPRQTPAPGFSPMALPMAPRAAVRPAAQPPIVAAPPSAAPSSDEDIFEEVAEPEPLPSIFSVGDQPPAAAPAKPRQHAKPKRRKKVPLPRGKKNDAP